MARDADGRVVDPTAAALGSGKNSAADNSRSARSSQLSALAEQINTEHEQAHRAARTALGHALECGRLLLEAKTEIGHGGWLAWIEANLSFGARQAQKYLRLAEHADALPNATSDAHLTIDGALAALADHRGDPPPADDPWWSLPPVERARSCRQWPDQRDGAVLYLHLCGQPATDIAATLGLDVREVEASLFPTIAPIQIMGDGDQLEHARARAATAYAEATLAHFRQDAALKAQAHAGRSGRDDVAGAARRVEQDAAARAKHHWQRCKQVCAECLDRELAAVSIALGIAHARAAVGLEVLENWFVEDGLACAIILAQKLPENERRRLSEHERQASESTLIARDRLGEATFDDILASQRQRHNAVISIYLHSELFHERPSEARP